MLLLPLVKPAPSGAPRAGGKVIGVLHVSGRAVPPRVAADDDGRACGRARRLARRRERRARVRHIALACARAHRAARLLQKARAATCRSRRQGEVWGCVARVWCCAR